MAEWIPMHLDNKISEGSHLSPSQQEGPQRLGQDSSILFTDTGREQGAPTLCRNKPSKLWVNPISTAQDEKDNQTVKPGKSVEKKS